MGAVQIGTAPASGSPDNRPLGALPHCARRCRGPSARWYTELRKAIGRWSSVRLTGRAARAYSGTTLLGRGRPTSFPGRRNRVIRFARTSGAGQRGRCAGRRACIQPISNKRTTRHERAWSAKRRQIRVHRSPCSTRVARFDRQRTGRQGARRPQKQRAREGLLFRPRWGDSKKRDHRTCIRANSTCGNWMPRGA